MKRLLLALLLSVPALGFAQLQAEGLEFQCTEQSSPAFASAFADYLSSLGIPPAWVQRAELSNGIVYSLAGPGQAVSPLDFYRQAALNVRDEMIPLPNGPHGQLVNVQTVSKKEIVLALLHRGRLTRMPCDINALRNHVGLRQNIVAWTERLAWQWPDGGPASWNKKFWHYGMPKSSLSAALNDAFLQQSKYRIGCYTATKLVVTQGVLDYYTRVAPDKVTLKRILDRLQADGDPLVGIEPAAMWSFEKDYAPAAKPVAGKLVTLLENVTPDNFVPGDWVYLRNTDPVSSAKIGYEGSNAIYLGRDRFDDYYNDNSHSYSYREKLNEVYQWRNGVFSRSRHGHLAKPLAESDFIRLSSPPEQGGLVLTLRAVPYFFEYLP